MEKKISIDDLKVIREFRLNLTVHSLQVEKAVLESEKADLQYENTMLRMYVKYGLSNEFIINEMTGEITLKGHDEFDAVEVATIDLEGKENE